MKIVLDQLWGPNLQKIIVKALMVRAFGLNLGTTDLLITYRVLVRRRNCYPQPSQVSRRKRTASRRS